MLLENFRSDSAIKLGLTPEELLAKHPKLIVCSISGYGRTGAMKDLPGYDFAIQALSGLMAITGPVEGPPSKVGVAVSDVLTGLYAAVAVLACINARRSSGHGYAIDLALHDSALAAQVNVAQAYLTSGKVFPRQGNAHLQIVPYQLFQTADGWLVLAVGNDGQWQHFCISAGENELAVNARYLKNSQRVEHRDELVPKVAAIMRRHSNARWREILTKANVPHAEVREYDQVFRDPQVLDRGMKIHVRDHAGKEIDLLGSPFQLAGASLPAPRTPPMLGQDTDTVLHELLGIDKSSLEQLRTRGIV